MEIVISNKIFTAQKINIKDNICIIHGPNNSGKTKLLSDIYKGFKGQLKKNFFIDDKEVSFGDYQPIFLKNDYYYDNELKITKTNSLRDELIKFINNTFINKSEYEQLMEKINDVNTDLKQTIGKFFQQEEDTNLITKEYNFEIKLDFNSIEKIVDKLLKIDIIDSNDESISQEEISSFYSKMIILKILNLYIDWNDNLRAPVFIIDLPFSCCDYINKFKLQDYIKNIIKKNVIVIFSTNNIEDLNDLDFSLESLNFINDSKIFWIHKYDNFIKNSFIINSFIESDYENINDYKSDINKVIELDDVISEKQNFEKNIMITFLKILSIKEVNVFENINNNLKISYENNYLRADLNLNIKWYCYFLMFLNIFPNQIKVNLKSNNFKLKKIIEMWNKM